MRIICVHSTTILVQGRCFMMFDDRLGGSAIYKRPVKYGMSMFDHSGLWTIRIPPSLRSFRCFLGGSLFFSSYQVTAQSSVALVEKHLRNRLGCPENAPCFRDLQHGRRSCVEATKRRIPFFGSWENLACSCWNTLTHCTKQGILLAMGQKELFPTYVFHDTKK